MRKPTVLRAEEALVEEFDWGRLTWYASGRLGNAAEMTTGHCEIRPGRENSRHGHANCEEVLTVVSGTIRHWAEGLGEVEMSAGDTITIPPNVVHNARNVGAAPAVLAIAFSSADRQTRGE